MVYNRLDQVLSAGRGNGALHWCIRHKAANSEGSLIQTSPFLKQSSSGGKDYLSFIVNSGAAGVKEHSQCLDWWVEQNMK